MKLPIIGSNFFIQWRKDRRFIFKFANFLIYSTIIHIPLACSKNWDSTNNFVAAVVQSTTFKSQILKSWILSKLEIFFNFITNFYMAFTHHNHRFDGVSISWEGGLPYQKVEDARHLAQGFKSKNLASLREFLTTRHYGWWPFPYKRSVWKRPNHETTNKNALISLKGYLVI